MQLDDSLIFIKFITIRTKIILFLTISRFLLSDLQNLFADGTVIFPNSLNLVWNPFFIIFSSPSLLSMAREMLKVIFYVAHEFFLAIRWRVYFQLRRTYACVFFILQSYTYAIFIYTCLYARINEIIRDRFIIVGGKKFYGNLSRRVNVFWPPVLHVSTFIPTDTSEAYSYQISCTPVITAIYTFYPLKWLYVQ